MSAEKRPRSSHGEEDTLPRKTPRIADSSQRTRSDEVDSDPALDLSTWRVEGLTGAEVYYVPNFFEAERANRFYAELDNLDTWYHPTLKVYGKDVRQSRSIAAYATTKSISAKYSGHQVEMHYGYPPLVKEISSRVSTALGLDFNHIMLNRYASGAEYIGKHRDTKENGVIASLSLGAERTFILTPNKKQVENGASMRRLRLENGSLLVMKGSTQDNWKHEIPKEPRVKDGRISVTLRQLPE
ncbi:hypothetical protein AURDEDRAFT_168448 [Auricularia subglabra TFB-10046 SS5]|nr:hypothetical protein AURDEDRAFT_168448 [Auricularia subglabra TFB-10046 SS5]